MDTLKSATNVPPISIYCKLTESVEKGVRETADEYAEKDDAHAANILGRVAGLPVRALLRTALARLAELAASAAPAGRDVLFG